MFFETEKKETARKAKSLFLDNKLFRDQATNLLSELKQSRKF